MSDDPDTEEALKGFDFLASPDEMEGSPDVRSVEDSGDWGKRGRGVGWLVNTQTRIVKVYMWTKMGLQNFDRGS